MENGLTIHITGKEGHPTDVVIRNLSLYTNQIGIVNVGKFPVSADGKELSHLLFKRELTQQFLYIVKFPQSVAADRLRRSEEHTSELQSRGHLVCRRLLEKKKE